MSEFKGTKETWKIFKPDHIGCANLSFGENNGFNAFIELWHHQFENGREEAEANAQLISLAPLLLDELKSILENYFNGLPFTDIDSERIEQLIQKATTL